MKKNLLDSLKILSLHTAALLLRLLTAVWHGIVRASAPLGRALAWIYTVLLHPLVLITYSWYMRGALSLQRRGVAFRHPLLSLVSRKHIHHVILSGIFLATFGHTLYLKNANAQEFLIPHNTLSRLFFANDEFSVVEEGSQTPVGQEYVESVGERTQPTLEGTERQEARPTPDAGALAVIPDALVKPILPTAQREPYKATAIQTYSVRGGDTLAGIARAFGVKLATLLFSNDLTERATIREGQKLIILPVDGIQYRVRRGDTLAQIAQEYQSTVAKIMEANHRDSANDIAIGELLIIPGGVISRPRIVQQAQPRNLITRLRDALVPPPSTSGAVRGLFIWPTSANRVTQYFSWHHTGVDIAGSPTNRIYAAGDGRVEFAGWARGYGFSIVIDHGNGFKTRYGHSRLLYVGVGDYVSRGQTIAMVGSTGHSTGPHLHFEVIKNNIRVNPFGYIR